MTTITLPRAVVEQALEALEEACEIIGAAWAWRDEKGKPTITALRAALAQQAEPVAWEGWWLHHGQHNYRAKPLSPERVKELMKLAFEVGREATLPQQAEPDHETRAELAEQQVVQLAEERDHYRNLWQKAQQAEPVEPVAWVGDPSTQDYASTVPDPQVADRLARHGIPMPGDPKC